MTVFSDPKLVENYASRTQKIVPGFFDLHRMAIVLLDECVSDDAHILVLGAGGGLELKTFCEERPGWTFEGVDPSAEMLDLAREQLGPVASRVDFRVGYIHDVPQMSFDGATCFLTLHFLSERERRKTLQEVFLRLKPGAPFVLAHYSFPDQCTDQEKWLSRNAQFANRSMLPDEQIQKGVSEMRKRLPILSVREDEALLRAVGFENIEMFYAGFSLKGWVAYKPL
ncbi:methyltransferase [Advenella kashmirensis W13003]|uniref:Methyltransferase n=1 Tax=Advenella kashmirensis W13003 TaxID=1424334 RepID=V8QR84_9BURK|nr:class I SAM-dependent methyltransferase [Advenella kashmirensis]ETF02137.1 methyltransferase [Advenella kashmirensis W13003]